MEQKNILNILIPYSTILYLRNRKSDLKNSNISDKTNISVTTLETNESRTEIENLLNLYYSYTI